MHALPVKRHQMLTHGLITGLGTLFSLTLVIALIIYVISFNLIFDITFLEIVQWFLYSCFVIFVTYSFTIFVGMFIKRAPLQAVFTAAAMLLLYISWSLIHLVAITVFDGVPSQTFGYAGQDLRITTILENITFPLHIIDQMTHGYALDILFWFLFAAALIAATYVLYQHHHVERVSNPFYFNWTHIMLSAWLSILGMLVFGLGILFVFGNLTLAIFSYIVGLALSYIIVEMILQFTPRIKLSIRTMVVTASAALTFGVIFIVGWHLYLTQIPNENDIDGVYIQIYDRNIAEYTALKQAEILDSDFMVETNPEITKDVYEQHQALLDMRRPILDYLQTSGNYTYNMHTIMYQLNDGTIWTREFNISEDEEALFTSVIDGFESSKLDFLVNILNVDTIDEMYINAYTHTINLSDEEAKSFINDYQETETETPRSALSDLNVHSGPMLLPSITFNIDQGNVDYLGYHTVHDIEHVNFYNPAVTELLRRSSEARNVSISGMLGLPSTESIYMVNLDDDLDAFLDDIKTSTMEEIMSDYSVNELEDKELSEAYDKIDAGEFDGNSNTLIIFEPIYSEDFYSIYDYEIYQDEIFIHTPLVIVGIEE